MLTLAVPRPRLAGFRARRQDSRVPTGRFVGDPLEVLQAALAGRYRLDRLVGEGGMGVVYHAHDLKHDRAVAIKVLRPGVAALLGPERFLREIGIAAQLRHPHIVPLYDSGEAEGLLYYVMPYVSGETLRARLDRDGRLPPDEAVAITRQIASALAHAHARGVIHRDIKPTNVLLSEGFALVADFGIARAISTPSGAEISSVGLPIGTPRYMSPEQAMGSPGVDGRSDLYSLGCVLHEMLLGVSPRDHPAPDREGRQSPARQVPAELTAVLERCLALDPARRYASAEDLLTGLGGPTAVRPRARRLAVAVVTLALTALAAWAIARSGALGGFGSAAPLDTTRYAVFPFEQAAGAPAYPADVTLRNALARWSGISVVGGVEVGEALKSAGTQPLDRALANRIATRLGAGRIVRGQIVLSGDSVQVEALVFDTRQNVVLVGRTVRVPKSLTGAELVIPGLADSLLFRGAMPVEHFYAPAGTRSVAALWEFIRGRDAVGRWDLAAADSGFGRALSLDSAFARSALWLAQVRMWQSQPARTWRASATRALSGAAALGTRDSALAAVLEQAAEGDYARACPGWLELTRKWPGEFPVWYGAANCLGRDGGVLRSPLSPSGWTFRSSYQQVQLAWRKAFGLLPAIYRDYRGGGLGSSSWLLWTSPTRARAGSAIAPDTGLFLSYPSWDGDSLAFFPRRLAEFTQAKVLRPGSVREAVTRQRLAFYDLATEWASADPQNVEAREAVALALWSLGNPSAIDSVRATRAAARSPSDRVRLGVSEVLMRILGAASDPVQVRLARAIADSVLALRGAAPDIDPWDLATVAALTGRAAASAQLIRLASPRTMWQLPPAVGSDALALLAFAALGGPLDSLRSLESHVADGIASGVESNRRDFVKREWLGRPLSLVALDVRLPSLASLENAGDYLIDAEGALARRDSATTRGLLARAAASRSGFAPAEIGFEAILPEGRLFAAMRDRKAATALLDPTLRDLLHVPLQQVSNPVGAALLTRSFAFRADLASDVKDTATARRWARAVAVLWSDADPYLKPVVERMQRLAGATP